MNGKDAGVRHSSITRTNNTEVDINKFIIYIYIMSSYIPLKWVGGNRDSSSVIANKRKSALTNDSYITNKLTGTILTTLRPAGLTQI
jgi:hypothetical protein